MAGLAAMLSVAGLAALWPAQAGASGTAAVSRDRSDDAATHSPMVERMLAGDAAAAPVGSRSERSVRAATAAAPLYPVQGIDVASLQHPGGAAINWTDVAEDGYAFAFIKATEGSYYTNPYYAADEAGARAAGLVVAPYAFAIPNYSGGTLQADYALDSAGTLPDGQSLPLIVDLEYDPYAGQDGTPSGSWCYDLTPAQMVSWISAFVTEVQRRTGQLPIIYTVADWWDQCTDSSTAFSADPLWVASAGTSSPTLPAGWTGWTFWQYTASAEVAGISGQTDASYLSGSALELADQVSQSNPTGTSVSLPLSGLDGDPLAAGGPAVSFSATGLPPALSISPVTGTITGTLPAGPAAFDVAVTESAAGLGSVTQDFTWYAHGTVTLRATGNQSDAVGNPVRVRLAASDGLSGCTLRFIATGLPRGLSISNCGMISGWPQAAGEYRVTVHVTDSSGAALGHGKFSWKVTRATGQGPAGHIVLRRDGKCLTELSATDIAIETCNSGSAQRWTIASDGSVRLNGKCLAASTAKTSAAAALELTSCSNGGQRWQLESDAVLESLTSGRCLSDGGSENGSRASAALCVASPNATGSASTPSTSQEWTLPAGPLTAGISGYCASDLRSAGAPAGAVTLQRCSTSAQQSWTVEPDGAISVDGHCLSLPSGQSAPGTPVRLARCQSGADQVWQLAGGPINVQVLSPAAGLCLADPGDRAAARTVLSLEPCVPADPGTNWRVS
ncbi:MAG TPA: GH25 family lysozyme [Streptosporangiaceae bacterium]|nr:GH25 family lysozyme [Streptosporangiaceae bacterium]